MAALVLEEDPSIPFFIVAAPLGGGLRNLACVMHQRGRTALCIGSEDELLVLHAWLLSWCEVDERARRRADGKAGDGINC